MTIWFTSDTHFGHANFLNFQSEDGNQIRPFPSVEVMNETMMTAWRERVRPSDHIYHLGDVTMARGSRSGPQAQQFISLIRSLPGHKRLIMGNHDHFPAEVYLDAGFEIRGGCWKGFDGITLTHIPIHPDSLTKRFPLNVHGHIHERLVMLSPHHPDPRYMNISVEQTNYAPIPLEDLQQRLREVRS